MTSRIPVAVSAACGAAFGVGAAYLIIGPVRLLGAATAIAAAFTFYIAGRRSTRG